MSQQSRRIFAKGGFLATLLTPWSLARADDGPAPDGPELSLKELSEKLGLLEKQYDALTHNLSIHSVFDPPIGSVVTFAGEWPPINPATGARRTEAELGWALCDGRRFDHQTLAEVSNELRAVGSLLGVAGLPDYRGVFLRGLDRGIDGKPSDPVRDPLANRALGSRQDWATGRPKTDFVTGNESVDHDHGYSDAYFAEITGGNEGLEGNEGDTDRDNGRLAKDRTTGIQNQKHIHTVTGGGDAETRPVNVAVNYIIKFRAAPNN